MIGDVGDTSALLDLVVDLVAGVAIKVLSCFGVSLGYPRLTLLV